jgi:hypothetical protein
MYGTGIELPGGDAIVPAGMKSLADSMAGNVQVRSRMRIAYFHRETQHACAAKSLLRMHSCMRRTTFLQLRMQIADFHPKNTISMPQKKSDHLHSCKRRTAVYKYCSERMRREI